MTDFDSRKKVNARDPDSREGYCTELTEAAKGKKKKGNLLQEFVMAGLMITTLEKYHLQLIPLLGLMFK